MSDKIYLVFPGYKYYFFKAESGIKHQKLKINQSSKKEIFIEMYNFFQTVAGSIC
jgi:hypothetical protein